MTIQQSEENTLNELKEKIAFLEERNDLLTSFRQHASDISHDFNNILTGILGNISLAKTSMRGGGAAFFRLEEAEKAALRAKDLAVQLTTFFKGESSSKTPLFLNDLLVQETEFSLRGSNIKIRLNIDKNLRAIEVDRSQIGRVIQNLVINARQAMPNGGLFEMTAGNLVLESDNLGEPFLKKGKYVVISFKDEGNGIPSENLGRVFEPYFTTKEHGTGVGLSIAYAIVKKHEGHLTLESRPGRGTTFKLYLPASSRRVVKRKVKSEIIKGTGNALVADDDDNVREVLAEMLRFLGYHVSSARSGEEAVSLFKKEKQKGASFQVVITDLALPGETGGHSLLEKIKALDPGAKVIASSGYSNPLALGDFKKHGFAGAIIKPYLLPDLSKVVHDVLHKK